MDGAATFAGEVKSTNGIQSGGNSTAGFSLNPGTDTAVIGVQGKSSGAAGNALFQGWYGSSNTFRVNCDGGATFKGDLTLASGSAPTVILSNPGDAINAFDINTSSTVGNGSGLIRVYNNDVAKARIEGDGSFQSATNSYGNLSDIKLKENIVDSRSQWNDLKALQVRNFNFKEETGQQTRTQIGLIAQEVETVSPGLVSESPDTDKDGNDLGTVTKSVKYSVLYMKAVKALQEAMAKIETLEAKVTALENS